MLLVACEALDAIEWARGEIEAHGRLYDAPSGMKRANPALAIKERSEKSLAAALRELGVSVKAKRAPRDRRTTPTELRPVHEEDPRRILGA
jgi:phage terminase small subunit